MRRHNDNDRVVRNLALVNTAYGPVSNTFDDSITSRKQKNQCIYAQIVVVDTCTDRNDHIAEVTRYTNTKRIRRSAVDVIRRSTRSKLSECFERIPHTKCVKTINVQSNLRFAQLMTLLANCVDSPQKILRFLLAVIQNWYS